MAKFKDFLDEKQKKLFEKFLKEQVENEYTSEELKRLALEKIKTKLQSDTGIDSLVDRVFS